MASIDTIIITSSFFITIILLAVLFALLVRSASSGKSRKVKEDIDKIKNQIDLE